MSGAERYDDALFEVGFQRGQVGHQQGGLRIRLELVAGPEQDE
ncbi:hypothetical protein [Frankia sp. CiP3]|nr:hypothetical protein [Frankia sp. CiP3]